MTGYDRIIKRGALLLLLLPVAGWAQPEWFPFGPGQGRGQSAFDMRGWLDAPAGKHGFIRGDGNDFVCEDGTRIKFWGVNIASNRPFIAQNEVGQWVDFLTRYGINGVRFHKFTWHAYHGDSSTRLDPAKWERFDYFQSKLRAAGIYYGWSHIYGHKPLPADRGRLLAYDEIINVKLPWAHLNATTASLVNFAEDLQDLNIELTVHMLNHRNPHTGLRYADDPALSFVELQNEDNIFWSAIEKTLEQTPTYRALLCQKFSAWLARKYRSEAALRASWGNNGLAEGESLHKENIYPKPNHSWFSAEYEKARRENRPVRRHYLDRAQFLYEEQVTFYNRFVAAIRRTGYRGPVVGSCWQAGTGLTHLYNLHADYSAGIIDRHNYSGGETGHHLVPGKVDNTPMVAKPGSGLLGTGLQQVEDRPFVLSEWMSLIPNEWTAEASPVVAAYGMGLQGWDGSYAFALDYPHFTKTLHTPGVYNVTSPTQLALYPALAAMLYRNDVQEGTAVVRRPVNLTDLAAGKTDFAERVEQDYDRKQFSGDLPTEALAVGPVKIDFNAATGAKTVSDWDKYWDKTKKVVRASTGQLEWHYGGKGYFTINTPGTKGMVGFAGGEAQRLGDVTLQTDNPFAVVLVSSLERDQSLEDCRRMLVTTVARARNTNMTYNADTTQLLQAGEAPVLLEPVRLTLGFARMGRPVVHVLDHDGVRTGRTVPVKAGHVQLDGARTKTMYYEVEWR